MLITRLLKNVFSRDGTPAMTIAPAEPGVRSVLNVGGNNKQIPIPGYFSGWRHELLDIAPGPDVDVVCDARQLLNFNDAQFDAIYCSHNLEHFFPHDVSKVLAGFLHVLKADGFVDIRVPDMTSVLQAVAERGMELDDTLYTSPAGPITAHDVIYGWGKEIERSGVDFFAHKRGFSAKSLAAALNQAGFAKSFVHVSPKEFEVKALAFKSEPTPAQIATLGLLPDA